MNNILKLSVISMAVSLAACGGSTDEATQEERVINSVFDVTNPTDSEQVYKYYSDSIEGSMTGPSNYGALAYGVDGHTMFPNFTTYLFKDGTDYYKAQVLSNYGQDGTESSGNLYVRYAQVGSATDYLSFTASYDAAGYADLVHGVSTTSDQAWHFAYQRGATFSVNGGISGSGNVSVCVAHTPNGLYSEDGSADADAFKALTYDNTLADFEAVTANSCEDADFKEDTLKPQIDMDDWTEYNHQTHTVTLNTSDTNRWVIQSATQGDIGYAYGRVKVSALTYTYPTDLSITLDVEQWNNQNSVFETAETSPIINFTNGRQYWDLETNSIVTENDDWELSIVLDNQTYKAQIQVNDTAGVGFVLTAE